MEGLPQGASNRVLDTDRGTRITLAHESRGNTVWYTNGSQALHKRSRGSASHESHLERHGLGLGRQRLLPPRNYLLLRRRPQYSNACSGSEKMTVKIIAVVSAKGGVGKTSICANLSAGLTRLGHTVLSIDLDPQNSLRLHFGLSPMHKEGMAPASLV